MFYFKCRCYQDVCQSVPDQWMDSGHHFVAAKIIIIFIIGQFLELELHFLYTQNDFNKQSSYHTFKHKHFKWV